MPIGKHGCLSNEEHSNGHGRGYTHGHKVFGIISLIKIKANDTIIIGHKRQAVCRI
jgi:hypothetical protein